MIAMHRELPVLRLEDQHGALVSTWQFKHQHPLVIAFLGADASLVASFTERIDGYRSVNARVLAVMQGSRADAGPIDAPFPVLADDRGEVTCRYAGVAPATIVTDAYGVLEGLFAGPPDHDRIIRLVRRLEMRCPECGVPEWPADTQ